ncbi:hypothetical protein [Enterococcus sp. LJL51]|uniref:hypothetical protein n=1 Tax=Enterococcus sp. LJL51 TaxID=3416656 RepID=UPI003CED95B6
MKSTYKILEQLRNKELSTKEIEAYLTIEDTLLMYHIVGYISMNSIDTCEVKKYLLEMSFKDDDKFYANGYLLSHIGTAGLKALGQMEQYNNAKPVEKERVDSLLEDWK